MPAHVEHMDGKWRVVEPNGDVIKNKKGHAVDGGGHMTHEEAMRQAMAINASQNKSSS